MHECLLSRTVVYCDPTVPRNTSFSHNCYWGARKFQPSNFKQRDYHEATWFKWELLEEATRSGPSLFVDADVLVLRNPFPCLPTSGVSIHYQRENQNGNMNGGVIWLRNNTLAHRLLSLKPREFTAKSSLDQEIVYRELSSTRDHAILPTTFAGHCWAKRNDALMRVAVTYHAHCANLKTS